MRTFNLALANHLDTSTLSLRGNSDSLDLEIGNQIRSGSNLWEVIEDTGSNVILKTARGTTQGQLVGDFTGTPSQKVVNQIQAAPPATRVMMARSISFAGA